MAAVVAAVLSWMPRAEAAEPAGGGRRTARAWDFLNSIGVCLHIQHGDDAARIAPLLRYTGVRNVRDAADGNYDMSGLLLVHREGPFDLLAWIGTIAALVADVLIGVFLDHCVWYVVVVIVTLVAMAAAWYHYRGDVEEVSEEES